MAAAGIYFIIRILNLLKKIFFLIFLIWIKIFILLNLC